MASKDFIMFVTAEETAVPNPETRINWGCPRPFASFMACTMDVQDKNMAPETCFQQLQAFDACLKANNISAEDLDS
ncbi:hypothetical protein PROFUN_04199 [Planoprotostelium fungivorum]|uniref:CHCH domain-containing protein n=1 Tax=Planoprotostelium fungivorum TaxID=1890364 RepID=A0A2P6NW57_9EUKA|nr:hypothetical protein PROFUN_04199 [Planoprotostelium fungivorum]